MTSTPAPFTPAALAAHGVSHVQLYCPLPCGRSVDVDVSHLPAGTDLRAWAAQHRCVACGHRGPAAQPAWHRGPTPHGTPGHGGADENWPP